MKLGCHVSMSAPSYFLGSIEEALSYGATAAMIYTGAPQNTARKPISDLKVKEALIKMEASGLQPEQIIVHAPYIINLGNTIKTETYELAVMFLEKEIKRVAQMGLKYLVLHPGAHIKAGADVGMNRIVEGLNYVLNQNDDDVMILLETMSGKGTEIGRTFTELAYIRNHVDKKERIGICLDTCHVHDAGYDVSDIDQLLEDFDKELGLELLKVIHLNDSKNEQGASKDRHANIGEGFIGFSTLHKIVHHPKLKDVVKILETPYIDGVPPYKEEIEMLLK